jgi:hypothetical protein
MDNSMPLDCNGGCADLGTKCLHKNLERVSSHNQVSSDGNVYRCLECQSKFNCLPCSDESNRITSRLHREFDIGQKLGQGGYGSVYKCQHKEDKQFYAIKFVKPESKHDDISLSEILSEIELLPSLDHENIIRYYGCWTEDSFPERYDEGYF